MPDMADSKAPPPTRRICCSVIESALAYADRGWPVLPVLGKVPPKGSRGLHDATTDSRRIRRAWETCPGAGVAVRTGVESGVVAIDVDALKGGVETLAELEDRHGPLPPTPTSITGSGGAHYLFCHPGYHVKSVANALGPGVDVRGDGGYIVAPPSLHPNGRRYTWDVEAHPDDLPLAPLPGWLRELLEPAACPHSRDPQLTILEGRRNDALARIAGGLRRIGLSEEAIRAALLVTNDERCTPALDTEEVAKIARSVARYPAGSSTLSALPGPQNQENASSTNEITNYQALVSSVFGVAQNPHLRAEAAIALRIMTLVEHLHNRAPTDDGFYRVGDAQIADIQNRDKPIRSRATIGRAKQRLKEWGLFEIQTRASSRVKEVVDPATGEIATRRVPIKETWIKRDRPLVDKAMQLAAFVRPEATRQEAAPSKGDGGTSRQDHQERGAVIDPRRNLDSRSMDSAPMTQFDADT